MSSEKEITTISVRREDHRSAREVKRNGESWSLWIRRAAEALNEEMQD